MSKAKIYMGDFETTVTGDSNQDSTEVWASALVQVDNGLGEDIDEEVYVDNAIVPFFNRLNMLTEFNDIVVYFHNLKFDGTFILHYLLTHNYTASLDNNGKWNDNKYMSKHTFKCVISDLGQWYSITVKLNSGKFITFKDSLKLLPFTVEQIGKSFGTKHKKLSMEYVGDRKPYGVITDEEKEYIKNDVLVVKEALEIMFADGLDKLTIGSCCKDQYKKSIMKCDLEAWYPSMSSIKLEEKFGAENADEYIRKSYKGGWCYLKDGLENKVFNNGITADVNSLYPSVMISCDYPTGKPTFWKGNYIPKEALAKNRCYFIRVRTRFYLKDGFLPTLQIKNSAYYKSNEWLKTSDIEFNGQMVNHITKPDGTSEIVRPVLTLTQMDYELLQKHYDLRDFEILDGCYFWKCSGKIMFGDYINKWAEVKKTSKGAKRQQAKLFLNNLYGKFSSKVDNTTKLPYLEDGVLKFKLIKDVDYDKEWYIPVGAYITSHARNFTISVAQQNYEHFIYADTDSIHCNCKASDLVGVKVHPVNFCCWALEATWDKAIFVRQKTYIERVIEEDLEPIENPYFNIKCAGMGKRPKQLLEANLDNKIIPTHSEEEKDFLSHHLTLSDFKIGLVVPSNLKARSIKGGTLLKSSPYVMR